MTDKELLELSAKAAGYCVDTAFDDGPLIYDGDGTRDWNPLFDDGDALRLAVKLRINIEPRDHVVAGAPMGKPLLVTGEMYRDNAGDEYAATRRAIVRAAAEIGKMNSD